MIVPFLPKDVKYIIADEKTAITPNVAIFYSPNTHNFLQILKYRLKYGTKCIYWLHEPITFKNLFDPEYNPRGLLFHLLGNTFNWLITLASNTIILPSEKAVNNYKRGWLYVKRNYLYIPLPYDDENRCEKSVETKAYFAYIGVICPNHSFDAFFNFVERCIQRNEMRNLKFLIATPSALEIDEHIQKLLETERLIIVQGKYMSNEEINRWYGSSLVVWNAYKNTTQSGVMAKSFMFGTPLIVLKKNLNEFTENGQNVAAINDNTDHNEISCALQNILSDYERYSSRARQTFLDNFYYRTQNSVF
jgi:glycosyltransferase involved in cell wall biosynthesis